MNNKIVIESLSMDLMRVAIGYNRKSIKMADRFSEEAMRRISEIQKSNIEPYFVKILEKIPTILLDKDKTQKSENALTYSILCKNYARKFLS